MEKPAPSAGPSSRADETIVVRGAQGTQGLPRAEAPELTQVIALAAVPAGKNVEAGDEKKLTVGTQRLKFASLRWSGQLLPRSLKTESYAHFEKSKWAPRTARGTDCHFDSA